MALFRRQAVLIKAESTYGSDPTPSASADGVIVEDLAVSYPAEIEDPAAAAGSISPVAHITTRRTAEITFSVPIKGSGTAGTAPEWAPALLACGFGETVDPGVDVVYAPISDSIPSVTIYVYIDGLRYRFNGCRGNVAFELQSTAKGVMRFTMIGKPVEPDDVAFPTLSNTDTTPALRVESLGFTWGGATRTIAGFALDMGNAVQFADDVNAANSLGEAILADRTPTGTIDPEVPAVATENYYNQWTAADEKAIAFALTGAAGNIATFSIPKAVIREITPTDRNGVLSYEIGFTAVGSSSGDDELTITLT